ncbi:hypothetical protein [Flavivirga spongiicola]|uniref:Uncharacterized protein n=1 Tax=Flavivirga spongiicola TaxID=421621 RepID=A0ABU7XNW0_9FLAO|nr:hypothetical protein [Flavivirga sp. MEBiC05379]MDO5981273.1 hypothetical protein [Flavivirga sp. MEBiC05379]
MKELDLIQVYGDGKTVPEIASGTDIILVQNNTVQVGKLNLGEQYDFYMEIDHPKNQGDLDILATEIIKEKKPEYLKSKNSVIAICPKIISDKIIWE